MAAATVARSAARSTRATGRAAAASAPRGAKGATGARYGSRAAKIDAAASVAALKRPKLRVRDQGGVHAPVVTALVVVIGAGFLHAWVVEKKAGPGRKFLVQMAILGFVLSLMSELTPKLGKGMAYLVMTAVIFDRSQDILKGLQAVGRPQPERSAPVGPPASDDVVPAVVFTRVGPTAAAPVVPPRVVAASVGDQALFN